MSNDNKNPQSKEAEEKAAAEKAAAEEKARQEAASKAAGADKKAPASKYPAVARVRTTTGGTMRHLLTNVEIGPSEKKIDIDGFAIAQIEAGKWEIVTD